MRDSAATAAHYVHSLCQLLVNSEVAMGDLLTGTNLEPEQLLAPDRYVDHDTLDRVLQNIEQHTNEPFPGVRLGHHLNISAHGLAGYAGLTAPNAGQALEVAVRFFPLITSLATLRLRLTTNRACLEIVPAPRISGRTERFVVHTLLASFDVMGSFLVGHPELRAGLAFPEQPDLAARLGSSIGALAFNQAGHSLSLPRAKLGSPFALADRTAHAQAVAQCEQALRRLVSERSLRGRILALLNDGKALSSDQESMAARLGMSPRTLHRRLLAEGVSYRELMRQVRIEQAKRCLRDQRLSVTETAYRLGYQDSANFSRAFRQATGMTPTGFANAGSDPTSQPAPAHPPETDPPAPVSSPRST